ncbi:MAG: hypothetical protein QNK15_06765 [Cycloclasticus sp.]|nr:hypothetical protein [Cycloclasticus sp.]
MNRDQLTKLVIQPEISFDSISNSIESAGWVYQSGVHSPPLIAGEPEFASWSLDPLGLLLSYTFNPVVNLRVLSFSGSSSDENFCQLVSTIPQLTAKNLEVYLGTIEPRKIMLGLFASIELESAELLPLVLKLANHSDRNVAELASVASKKLSKTLAFRGIELLRKQQEESGDQSTLFQKMQETFDRRQILRWIAKDYDVANAEIIKVLKTGLNDNDLEIRLTSMLVAVRLGANELYNDIRNLKIPNSSKEGFDHDDRSVLRAVQAVCLSILRGSGSYSEIANLSKDADGSENLVNIAKCLNGDSVELNRTTLLLNSLIEPLPIVEPPTEKLPVEVQCNGSEYHITGTTIALSWVAPVTHFLGNECDFPRPITLKSVTPARGFFISTRPLTNQQVGELTENELQVAGNLSEFWRTTWRSAAALVDHLSANASVDIDMPTSEQWEMASRGPDGRRYPWGNILQLDWRTCESPWGLTNLFCNDVGEWALSDKSMPILVGNDKSKRCSSQQDKPVHDHIAVTRIVINY